jgi:hypothetical protein
MPTIGLQVEVVYVDNEAMRLQISGSNGKFGGTAEIYVGVGQIDDAARQLLSFPVSVSDRRKIALGASGANSAGGMLVASFSSVDRAGHLRANLKIEAEADLTGNSESAQFALPIEAASVDEFVHDLRRMEKDRKGAAFLKGAID